MGQHVSLSRNNDELINSLIKRKFIRTMDVEKVFRSVDRGFYYDEDHKPTAYRDSAWQMGLVHLSAPCIYAKVLECLTLRPGNKFLNIGSGIGYFSTVAGLLLGNNGVNHGIEIHQSLIDKAYQKMEEFKLNSAAIDHHDFCEPIFIKGNACELLPTGFYDKVYCGAGVPPEECEFMKSLINIGGILVMPLDGYLLKITRKDEHTWQTVEVLEVSFTELVIPEKCSFDTLEFPPVEPLSLQELCRSNIRSLLRENLKIKCPDLPMHTKCPLKINSDENDQMVFCFNDLNLNDPLTRFFHIQYGVSAEELVSLRDIVHTFVGLNEVMSDDELNEDSEENDDNDDDDEVDHNLDDENDESTENVPDPSEQSSVDLISDESTKRKLPEAGSSVQNVVQTETETETETENPKRMKMNLSTQGTASVPSTSSTASELWETISTTNTSRSSMLQQHEDSESWVSSMEIDDEDVEGEDDYVIGHFGNYEPFSDDYYSENSDSDTDSETSREIVMYRFISERKENKLSKLLKVKIDSLPIPIPLKFFLNYNRVD